MEDRQNNKEPRSYKEQVMQTVEKVIERIEREVPERGDFGRVMEFFPNLDPLSADEVKMYGLAVFKMPDDVQPDSKQRYIEASAYEPSGSFKASLIVGSGHKDVILARLRDPEFIDKLEYTYADLIEMLRD